MKPYSKEFRGQVLAACDNWRSTREVATYFDVSESWVRRIKQERRELNKTAPLLKRRRTPLWAALADRMRELIQQKPDLTLRELKAELHTERGPKRIKLAREDGRQKASECWPVFPTGHWKTTTFLAALRTTGLTAPLVVDGAINGELFLSWVQHH